MTPPSLWLLPVVVGLSAPALAADAPGSANAEVLTQLAAVAASRIEGTEVLSSKDIQDIVSLEGEKALMGCDDAGACLAEVAGALGARLVVFGQLGQLGDVLVLTLNLFDAESGSSSGRSVVRAETVAALGDKVEPAVAELVGSAVARIRAEAERAAKGADDSAPAATAKVRVLVMDLRVAGGVDVAPPAPAAEQPSTVSWLTLAGVALGIGAIAALGTAGLSGKIAADLDREARAVETLQKDVPALVEQRDAGVIVTNVLLLGGTALLLGSGGLIAYDLLGGE